MSRREVPLRRLLTVALLLWLGAQACAWLPAAIPPSPRPPGTTAVPGATAVPGTTAVPPLSPAPPTPTPLPPDTGWALLRPGLERRWLTLYDDAGVAVERIYLLRIDPALYRFDVGYRPGAPQSLRQWGTETGALVLANGGYFTEAYQATGLVIAGGRRYGATYGDFAGMLAVTAAGPTVRWLQQTPYDPNEPLLAALQSFPILVKPGGVAGFVEPSDARARRTVLAQDRAGRLLLLAAGWGHFTLPALSQFLASGDLDLEIAVNLDGGPSTALFLAEPDEGVPGFSVLPTVILVYGR